MRYLVYFLAGLLAIIGPYFVFFNELTTIDVSDDLPKIFVVEFISIVVVASFILQFERDDHEAKTNELKRDYERQINAVAAENHNLQEKLYSYGCIEKFKQEAITDIKKLIDETKIDFPYFASILADYRYTLNMKYADQLLIKKRPAPKTAEKLRQVSHELRIAEKEKKLLELQQGIYEDIFPWLSDFKEISKEDISQIIQDSTEPADEREQLKYYLSPLEYDKLSKTEKYQLALDRYKSKKKTNWQIGIAFERYIGYLYEMKNYKVIYYGATMGMSDLGRDIIAINSDEVIVIQCKYWNTHKTIHEKHIFQLYGTMLALTLEDYSEYKDKKIRGLFITSTSLSDKAKLYANKLQIDYIENENFDKDYPCIKCNISRHNQQKIYHLPFDQQYDRIQIELNKGECYAETVAEAEKLGFRRANRWVGSENII